MHSHNIHSVATVINQIPRGGTLFLVPLTIFWKYSKTFLQQPENIQRLSTNNRKIFKDFFACKIVLAANHQLYPRNIQRLLGQESAASNQQATSNQPAATSKHPAATSKQPAINSSSQQQQPATAINSSS